MSRARSFVWIPAFAILVVSPAFSQDDQPPGLKGWGVVVDPDRDCRIGLEGEKLTITVPPKRHDLSIEVGDMNAPRVLQEIQGDFIAQLKVSGKVRHTGNRTSEHYLAYHGAGFLLWQDERTYIRLDRASVVQDEAGTVHYANFGLRQNAKLVDVEKSGIRIADHDAYLRLERRGDRVFRSVSQDGVRWMSFDPYVVDLNAALKLGVAAINTSTEPFKAEFAEFEIFLKKAAK
jgi:regulation of enolase protein 1 (concanavalin A-like superfamily)